MTGVSPKPPVERRTDSLRRAAFDQRDRSKRLGLATTESKSSSKMSALEQPALRWV